MVSVTAFGRVPPGKMVHRSGAKPGERVMVTGTIGDAALGLAVLKGGKVHAAATDTAAREALVGRYRVPQPRVAMAEIVRDHASAAMDVSDGLAGDLTKLCGVSGVSAVIDLASIPLSGAARDLVSRGIVGLETLIAGGDDYEILCTIAEDRVEAFAQAARACRRRREFHRNGGRGKRGSEVHRRAGQGNRAGTAVLQPFLKVAALTPSAFISRQPLQFRGKPIGVSPFDYRRAFSNAPLRGFFQRHRRERI